MRTEISNVLLQFIRRRRDYNLDKDGKHKAKKLEVTWKCIGFSQPDEIVGLARRLMKKKYKGAGRRRKFVALELTVHPSDENRQKNSFRNRLEMEKVAEEVKKEFHIRYALIAFHGLRDLHILALNWGPTGLALKSYLPNRSNPRRVLVAVVDRVEKELIAARKEQGAVLLRPMASVRAAMQKAHCRPPMHEQLATHLSPDCEPEVVDILRAIRECGWHGAVKYSRRCDGVNEPQKVSISFDPSRPSKPFEWDLFMRGVRRALQKRREKDRKAPSFEQLVAQVHRYMQGDAVGLVARPWLEFGPSKIVPTAQLQRLLRVNDSEVDELKAALESANATLAERGRERYNEHRPNLPI